MSASRPSTADLDYGKTITTRQHRYIKLLCSEHLLRAESVARAVIGCDLADLNQVEAHQMIQYLERLYTEGIGSPYTIDFDMELGRALTRTEERDTRLTDEMCVLALLATNRIATPGQLARYAYGVNERTFGCVRERIAALLEEMTISQLIACAHAVEIPVVGKGGTADVYFLTEYGSDALHRIAPDVNYHARPGLPPASRLQHELAVTEARLDLQLNNYLEEYLPESKIRSEQEKERRKRGRLKGGRAENPVESGCGDFRVWLVDASSKKGRRVEVEVSIRARRDEIISKPKRIKIWYAATQHRCDLIELNRGEFPRLLPDVREPLSDYERSVTSESASAQKGTVGTARINKVREALEKMGGVGTPEAIAVVAGIKNTTASEALALLTERGEMDYRDGFPVSGKRMGRNFRLYLPRGREVHSIFEFARLLTASKLVSTGAAGQKYQRPLDPYYFDPDTGVMLLAGSRSRESLITIAVIDDPSETAERVANWAQAAHQQARDGTLKGLDLVNGGGQLPHPQDDEQREYLGPGLTLLGWEQMLIITADKCREAELRKLCKFTVVNLEVT